MSTHTDKREWAVLKCLEETKSWGLFHKELAIYTCVLWTCSFNLIGRFHGNTAAATNLPALSMETTKPTNEIETASPQNASVSLL
jgi:hypothetical protein